MRSRRSGLLLRRLPRDTCETFFGAERRARAHRFSTCGRVETKKHFPSGALLLSSRAVRMSSTDAAPPSA